MAQLEWSTLEMAKPRTGRGREPLKVRPRTADQIVELMQDPKRFPSPIRPVGANSGNVRCTRVQHGTILDMSGMNRIVQVGTRIVTVQAGMRLRDLVRELAEHGLELAGSYEQPDRSIGGLVSSGALSCGMAGDDIHLGSAVVAMTVVTARGRVQEFDLTKPKALALFRQSYGLLGIITQVSLRVRRASAHTTRSRKVGFAELAKLAPSLAAADSGVRLYLLPFRDRVHIELRESSAAKPKVTSFGWRIHDWLVNKLVPDFTHAISRVIPIRQLRDPLIDGFSEATQVLVHTKLMDANSNIMEQTGKFRRIGPSSRVHECCWLFPAEYFPQALYAYREYCRRHYKVTGFRCDLPAVGYRLPQDQTALLSPSFDGTVFALNLRSTVVDGWDDFLLDFGRIASRFKGIPSFNLTNRFSADQAEQAYGERLRRFRMTRRQADPNNRLLNQYFAEFIG